MAETLSQPEVPALSLPHCSASEYCRAILARRRCEMWWWQTGVAPYAGFSRPFEDRDGNWWWRVKVQFSWALDFFRPLSRPPRLPLLRSALGCQYPTSEAEANSLTHFNVIPSLANYDFARLGTKRRNMVRKALKLNEVAPLDLGNPKTYVEACEVWNSHVVRTSWSRKYTPEQFTQHWRPLIDMPGTRVLGARRRSDGVLCAWLIVRGVAGTLYVDTIASHTDRLDVCPNDALVYSAVWNAARTQGFAHANYFLRSYLEPIEKFKRAFGFDPSGIPSRVIVNPLMAPILRAIKPQLWKRLHGDWPRSAAPAASPSNDE